MDVREIAESINAYCEEYKYFWAIGLIKETLPLWRKTANRDLLCEVAQDFVTHYLEDKGYGKKLEWFR